MPAPPRVAESPEDLARLLVERVNANDLEGVVELYEPGAILALPDGGIAEGEDAIRRFYAALLATGPTFTPGAQSPPLRQGDLALTSTQLPGGGATAEVAHRKAGGGWRWIIDRPNVIP